MNFSVISYGFLLFFICFLLHIIIWRFCHPKRQILILFSLFLLFPILFHFLIHIFDTGELLQIYLLYYALSLAYIFTYPPAQAGCPSFIILRIIKSSMPRGVTKDEIYSYCLDKKLLSSRICDLINENLVIDKNGWLELTKKGRLILKFFIILRKIFGLPAGKG